MRICVYSRPSNRPSVSNEAIPKAKGQKKGHGSLRPTEFCGLRPVACIRIRGLLTMLVSVSTVAAAPMDKKCFSRILKCSQNHARCRSCFVRL